MCVVRENVDLHSLLFKPLAVIPYASFKEDGTRRVRTKAFLHSLEEMVSEHFIFGKTLNTNCVIIVDRMSELQSLNIEGLKTFNDILPCQVVSLSVAKFQKLLEFCEQD